jgi:GH15 family glucan-1,4-alpha-glucosidase
LRDATFTLFALVNLGYLDEAKSWREWLLRAIAGTPSQMQTLYGVRGERRLEEWEVPWLRGYENSAPVRIGNAATHQFQLDVFGEIVGSLFQAHHAGIKLRDPDWRLLVALLDYLETKWREPDEGIWEVRGGRRQFTHSKMMAWLAFDRAVKLIEESGFHGDHKLEHWKKARADIHLEVCERAYNPTKKAFTQYYGAEAMDASILLMPIMGFLPPNDPRLRTTVEAVERELIEDGFVLRYRPEEKNVDGLPGSEGVFLPCSFWFADCLHLLGRKKEARELFERLLEVRTDLGLLAEEYDPKTNRQLGNFPQAFSHVALVNTANRLTEKKPSLPGRHAAA